MQAVESAASPPLSCPAPGMARPARAQTAVIARGYRGSCRHETARWSPTRSCVLSPSLSLSGYLSRSLSRSLSLSHTSGNSRAKPVCDSTRSTLAGSGSAIARLLSARPHNADAAGFLSSDAHMTHSRCSLKYVASSCAVTPAAAPGSSK